MIGSKISDEARAQAQEIERAEVQRMVAMLSEEISELHQEWHEHYTAMMKTMDRISERQRRCIELLEGLPKRAILSQ